PCPGNGRHWQWRSERDRQAGPPWALLAGGDPGRHAPPGLGPGKDVQPVWLARRTLHFDRLGTGALARVNGALIHQHQPDLEVHAIVGRGAARDQEGKCEDDGTGRAHGLAMTVPEVEPSCRAVRVESLTRVK